MNCTFAKSTGRKAARIAIMATLSATGAALGAVGNGVLIRTVPSQTEDGWYELGAADYSVALNDFNSQSKAGLGYIDWAALAAGGLSSNDKVRFVGGVALDALPAGYTYDFTAVNNVMLLDKGLVGAFDIPANAAVVCQPVSAISKASETEGAAVAFTMKTGEVSVDTPLHNDGYFAIGKNSNSVVLNGGLTGSGYVNVRGVYWSVTVGGSGALDFAGVISAIENAQRIKITSGGRESHVKTISLQLNSSANYPATELIYDPVALDGEPCTLVVTNGILGKNKTSTFSYSAAQPRIGAHVCVCNGNTIKFLKLDNGGDAHCFGLVAAKSARYSRGNPPAFEDGFGNVIIGDPSKKLASGIAPVINMSPQMNLTFTGTVFMYGFQTAKINYNTESNVVNKAFLDCSTLENATVHQRWIDSFGIHGYAPYNLPRTITTKNTNAAKSQTVVHISDTAWTMPFDFSAAADEVNPNRCETNCSIDIPASGTVTVTNATPAGAASFPEALTEYPILTCASGGATAFADWTVEFAGNWAGAKVAPVVKDTGLYVSVKKLSGTVVLFK